MLILDNGQPAQHHQHGVNDESYTLDGTTLQPKSSDNSLENKTPAEIPTEPSHFRATSSFVEHRSSIPPSSTLATAIPKEPSFSSTNSLSFSPQRLGCEISLPTSSSLMPMYSGNMLLPMGEGSSVNSNRISSLCSNSIVNESTFNFLQLQQTDDSWKTACIATVANDGIDSVVNSSSSTCPQDSNFCMEKSPNVSLQRDSKGHMDCTLFKSSTRSLNCSNDSRSVNDELTMAPADHLYKNPSSQQNVFIAEYPVVSPTSNDTVALVGNNSVSLSNFEDSCRSRFCEKFCGSAKPPNSPDSMSYSHTLHHTSYSFPNEMANTEIREDKMLSSSQLSRHPPYNPVKSHATSLLSESAPYDKAHSVSTKMSSTPNSVVTFPVERFCVTSNDMLNVVGYSCPEYGPSFSLSNNGTSTDSSNSNDRKTLIPDSSLLAELCNSSRDMRFLVTSDSFARPTHMLSLGESRAEQPSLLPTVPGMSFKTVMQPQTMQTKHQVHHQKASSVQQKTSDSYFNSGQVPTIMSSLAKRPRGRPRKHRVSDVCTKTGEDDEDSLESPGVAGSVSRTSKGEVSESCLKTFPTNTTECLCSRDSGKLDKRTVETLDVIRKRALRCIKSLYSLQTASWSRSVHAIDSMTPQDEISEEYIALGGPYTSLALALEVQRKHVVLLKDNKYASATEASVDVLQRYAREAQQLAINLNSSFVWASLAPKVPVRDIAASRYHLVALLDDSRVFVYRHKTHPLVTSRVDQWEHVEALDNRGIVAVRIASANLPDDWRARYHAMKRLEFIRQIRQKLRANNVALPASSQFPSNDVTLEELSLFVEHHPLGILCCPTSSLDPDWLPDPFVIAALDRDGIVRIAKCCGFFNYPIVVNTPVSGASSQYSVFTSHEFESMRSSPKTAFKDNYQPYSSYVTKNVVHVDKVEKQLQLSFPLKEQRPDGENSKAFAQVQEIALAELTEESLMSSSNSDPEVAMILYALANEDHSAFVKGKNLYIRFKNFPTGPTKIYCGPLGHCGAVLLANGTVWTWTAQAKGRGSLDGKLGVFITQVNGSLEGKAVIDLMAIGADFLALTTDGVVHEWNCYGPYMAMGLVTAEVIIPQSVGRPTIPDPIELTPSFHKKILARRVAREFEYKVGSFSWGSTDQSPQTPPTNASSTAAQQRSPVRDEKLNILDDENKNLRLADSLCDTILRDCEGKEEEGLRSTSGTDQLLLTNKPHPFDSFFSPLSASGCNYLLSSETLHGLQKLDSLHDRGCEAESMDGWKESDYGSEAALEKYRQQEIRQRYLSSIDPRTNSPDLIKRIFFFEGVTMFLRASSCQFSFVLNSLALYRNGDAPRWKDVYCKTGEKSFNEKHAEYFIQTFGHLGRPLVANPVVLARMKLPHSDRQLDDQLREQLKTMADANPPTYRLLYSPISVFVCILRHYDFVAEARQRLSFPLPVPVAAHNPQRYLEAFSGAHVEGLYLPVSGDSSAFLDTSVGSDLFNIDLNDNDDVYDAMITSLAMRRNGRQRRGRGRVGRPRGSRSALRTALSQRHTKKLGKKEAFASMDLLEKKEQNDRKGMVHHNALTGSKQRSGGARKRAKPCHQDDAVDDKVQDVHSAFDTSSGQNIKSATPLGNEAPETQQDCVIPHGHSSWDTSTAPYYMLNHGDVCKSWDAIIEPLGDNRNSNVDNVEVGKKMKWVENKTVGKDPPSFGVEQEKKQQETSMSSCVMSTPVSDQQHNFVCSRASSPDRDALNA